ncbi:hypothetical protein EVA_14997 [gut metagenome]|uniref:Uncharacterized protein n=1 Tax=gut metagenome TaxID=749906 RepID=J9FPL9_9ZZZZ
MTKAFLRTEYSVDAPETANQRLFPFFIKSSSNVCFK